MEAKICGLVGVAGKLVFQDEFIMKRLLLADFFRGEHSTGMAAIRSSGEAVLAKIASNPIDLFGTKQFSVALNGNASRAFIGHNRQATRGKVNTVNAHPFQFDHIIGAHNGTLLYESHRDLEEAIGEKFDVDSMALIAGIAKLGVKETIKLCTEGKEAKEGAWAIVWFDQNDGTLNFLRNKHRPLWYAYEQGFQRMVWASEWWMIREALESSPNEYKIHTEKEGSEKSVGYFTFDPDVHYSFNLAELCQGSKKRPKPKAKPLKGKEPKQIGFSGNFTMGSEQWPRATQATSGTHGGTVGSQSYQKKTEHGSTTQTKTRPGNRERELVQLRSFPDSPYAGMLNKEHFKMMYDKCSWCKLPVKYGELGLTVFERDGRVLCRDCSGYDGLLETPPNKIYVPNRVFQTLL